MNLDKLLRILEELKESQSIAEKYKIIWKDLSRIRKGTSTFRASSRERISKTKLRKHLRIYNSSDKRILRVKKSNRQVEMVNMNVENCDSSRYFATTKFEQHQADLEDARGLLKDSHGILDWRVLEILWGNGKIGKMPYMLRLHVDWMKRIKFNRKRRMGCCCDDLHWACNTEQKCGWGGCFLHPPEEDGGASHLVCAGPQNARSFRSFRSATTSSSYTLHSSPYSSLGRGRKDEEGGAREEGRETGERRKGGREDSCNEGNVDGNTLTRIAEESPMCF